MNETFKNIASVIIVLILGMALGSYALYQHLRISSLEVRQDTFEKNVSAFAKQVNDEFAKIKKDKK
jgi:preprotein translocase subunit SecE